MGGISAAAKDIGLLVLRLGAFMFCTWVLYFVWQSAAVRKNSKKRKGSHFAAIERDVLCPVLFKRYSTVQFSKGLIVSSVTCLILSNFVGALGQALYLILCYNCAEKDVPQMADICFKLWGLLSLFGYLLLCVTHFERLRLTFKDTTRRLPKWAPRLLYAWLLLLAISGVLGLSFPMTAGIFAIVTILLYLAGVSALIHAFYSKTMAVARNTERVDEALVNTALRVTVCATVSVLSTTLILLFFGVLSFLFCAMCRPLWLLTINGLYAFDSMLNAFCLMCILRKAQHHYDYVFHWLHTLLLTRITSESQHTAAIGLAAIEPMPVTSVTEE